ncbi:hypothetical protein [Prochlorothrix hollandica]|nr:hypothetical protein [Prochlorothrix hollandica]
MPVSLEQGVYLPGGWGAIAGTLAPRGSERSPDPIALTPAP